MKLSDILQPKPQPVNEFTTSPIVPAFRGKNADLMRSLFNPTFAEQYELALREGERRFGSECKHTEVKDGICLNCFRKVK